MIKIKTGYLVLGVLMVFVVIFLLGRYFGLLSGDNASEALIKHQNDIIKQYVIDLASAGEKIAVQKIIIATQKEIIEQNFVHKNELDSIFSVQKAKLVQIEKKIEQLQDLRPVIIIMPVQSEYNDTLLSEKFREQNNLFRNVHLKN